MSVSNRAHALVADVEHLERELHKALCEVARLARVNGDLEDRVAELEEELAEANGRRAA